MLVWGSSPVDWVNPHEVVDASRQALRNYDSVGVTLAITEDRARLVVGTGDITALFASQASGVRAWSTHAVAAAYLAHGRAEIDESVLPELIGVHFLGGDRSVVARARAVDAATVIEIKQDEVIEERFWPRRERWRRAPEEEAAELAERALLESLQYRVRHEPVFCGVTAGFDSPVVAAALIELGISFTGLTVGNADDADVRGGKRISEALGVPHHRIGLRVPERYLEAIDRATRWSEGASRIPVVEGEEQPPMGTLVTGLGGETGRGFWYGLEALDRPKPKASKLARSLGYQARLQGAGRDVLRGVDSIVEGWLEDAESLGYEGWRSLDVVYSEQRSRRFFRAHSTPGTADFVPAFQTVGVQRALASLSLHDRLTSGFHRRFVSLRLPGLPLPPPPARRKGIPRPLRRAVAVGRRMRPPSRGRVPADPASVTEWILDEVLADSPAVRALGKRWAERVRAGYLDGDIEAVGTAHRAAAPTALERALRDLPRL